MKLSLSVKGWELLEKKNNFFEDLLRGFPAKNKFSLEKISQLVQENVIDGVEVALSVNTDENDLNLIKLILADNKISVLSVHQPVLKILKIDFDSITRLFKAAQKLSAKLIVIHLFALGKNIYNLSFVNKLKLLENEYGIKIGLENSIKNLFTDFWRPVSWDKNYFSKTVNKAGFGITLDTSHMGYSKGNIIDFYKNNQDKIINIHLSDCKNNIFGMHLPLGKGNLPIRDFLILLKESQYQGIVTLEINSGWEDLRRSALLAQDLIK